jgi:hypothetical protein
VHGPDHRFVRSRQGDPSPQDLQREPRQQSDLDGRRHPRQRVDLAGDGHLYHQPVRVELRVRTGGGSKHRLVHHAGTQSRRVRVLAHERQAVEEEQEGGRTVCRCGPQQELRVSCAGEKWEGVHGRICRYRWGGRGASKNPCTETYGGSGPFSEPETSAVRNFIQGNSAANWKAYISFHSYGQYVLYPWGYDRVVPPDYKDLESVGRKIASVRTFSGIFRNNYLCGNFVRYDLFQAIRSVGGPHYTVGPAANTLYPASGGSDDWAKGMAKFKYSYTIELRDNGRYGFVLPAAYIQPTATEALAAVRVVAEAAAAA